MTILKRYPLVTFYIVAIIFAGLWEGLYDIFGAGNPVFSILALFLASYSQLLGLSTI